MLFRTESHTGRDIYPIGRISARWHFSQASILLSQDSLHPDPENASDKHSLNTEDNSPVPSAHFQHMSQFTANNACTID